MVFVLLLWVGAIALFYHQWGKINGLEPYQPDFVHANLTLHNETTPASENNFPVSLGSCCSAAVECTSYERGCGFKSLWLYFLGTASPSLHKFIGSKCKSVSDLNDKMISASILLCMTKFTRQSFFLKLIFSSE